MSARGREPRCGGDRARGLCEGAERRRRRPPLAAFRPLPASPVLAAAPPLRRPALNCRAREGRAEACPTPRRGSHPAPRPPWLRRPGKSPAPAAARPTLMAGAAEAEVEAAAGLLPPPAPGGSSVARSSLAPLLTAAAGSSSSSSSGSRAAGTAPAASARIGPAAAAAPLRAPIPSFSSASPSSFYFLPPPPRFPSSSSFNLTSLQGREGGGGRDAGGAAAAHLIAHPGGGGGRRRLFSSPSIQGSLFRSAAAGPRQHHPRLLLPAAASRPWSCAFLGAAAAAARGDGIRGGDGPGGSGTARRLRGAFFSFSSPLLPGPDMEDGSNSASCFRRFTDCFLNTSRYRGGEVAGREPGGARGSAFLCERGHKGPGARRMRGQRDAPCGSRLLAPPRPRPELRGRVAAPHLARVSSAAERGAGTRPGRRGWPSGGSVRLKAPG